MVLLIFIAVILFAWYLFRVHNKSKSSIEIKGNPVDRMLKNSEELVQANLTKVKKYAQKTISKSYLTSCTWLLVNEDSQDVLYTFRSNDELLMTTNGIVEKGNFELIVDNNSLLITKNNIIEHYDIVNVQNDFLFLHKLSSDKILVFANQTKFKDQIKSIVREQAREIYRF